MSLGGRECGNTGELISNARRTGRKEQTVPRAWPRAGVWREKGGFTENTAMRHRRERVESIRERRPFPTLGVLYSTVSRYNIMLIPSVLSVRFRSVCTVLIFARETQWCSLRKKKGSQRRRLELLEPPHRWGRRQAPGSTAAQRAVSPPELDWAAALMFATGPSMMAETS